MPKQPRSPFDVKLSDDERDELATWLGRELDNALATRSATENEIAYWHTLYEQGRTRSALNSPWPDAADLTSPIATEKVDTLEAALVDTIFVDPICTCEGWGESAQKAPFVEEFMQWQAETEGFQAAFERAAHLAMIEPRGVLEVYEDRITRPVRKRMKVALALAPDGTALVGEDLQPQLQQGQDGAYVETTDEQTPSADVIVDDFEVVCRGPRHRVIAYRDFLQLPGHAREKGEVWGYAKRFWRRVDELMERVEQGIYDKKAVEDIGTDDERSSENTLAGDAQTIASKEDGLAEKELFEVLFLKKLDKSGYRWWVATIHKDRRRLLRLQYDDIGRPRYFSLVPFPRPNSTEGYSFVGHKLITIIEENTAWRNMAADRGAMEVQAPLKRKQGALWDPDEEPIGPKSVITVREMNEVEPLQMGQQTGSAIERLRDTERIAERLAGVADIAAGVNPVDSRTLGENRMVTRQSLVRMKKAIRNVQETLEEIYQVRLLMWKRALAEMPEGVEPTQTMLQGLETRGANVAEMMPDKKFTASLLDGTFRFKPKGSVENADKDLLRMLFNQSLGVLATLSRANMLVGAILQTPQAAKALMEEWVRLYAVGDKQAFLGPDTMRLAMQQLQNTMMMRAGGPPGGSPGPGGPPGPPPMAQGGAI